MHEHVINFRDYVLEYRGYLKALKRFCGSSWVFGLQFTDQDVSMDDFVRNFAFKQFGLDETPEMQIMEYETLMVSLREILNSVFEREGKNKERQQAFLINSLLEDIQEYYGLVSTSINPNGVFHPLIKNKIYTFNIENEKYLENLIFILQIETVKVATYILKKSDVSISLSQTHELRQ